MQKALTLLGIVVLGATAALAGPVLTPLPNSSLAGGPGETIGWGYSLFNDSATEWYLGSSISIPSFSIGTPVVLFDYPSVAPLSTVTQPYTGTLGLLQLILPANATIGSSNAGNVILFGDYWSGDPFSDPNATIVASAPDASAAINATVAVSAVPEPSTTSLVAGAGMIALLLLATRRGGSCLV